MAKTEKAAVPAAAESDVDKLASALAAPFDPSEVKFKPQTVSGNRALAVPFVDARVIQDRLDDVIGTANWQDSYECLPDGAVVCRLTVRLGEEWITKQDVGGQSEQPDEGDRRKAAFSDALKRAAVKYGIGRYLYRLKPQWVDYDPQKRQFLRQPALPSSALPTQQVPATAPAKAEATEGGPSKQARTPSEAPAEKKGGKSKPAAEAPAARGMPADGMELLRRLTEKDEKLAKEGLCKAGELVKAVKAAGVKAGHDADLTSWGGPAIQLAIDEVRAFEAARRQAEPKAA